MTAKKASSLQAVLDAQANKSANDTPEKDNPEAKNTKNRKPSRTATTLIGGHFAPEVSKQLAIIAAEEGSTKQALLAEALDLLFVKKGKGRIADL